MIPAPPGQIAYFETKNPNKKFTTQPILAFDDHGNALVLDAKTGTLRAANSYPNFTRASHDDDRAIGVAPGGGWEFAYFDKNEQVTHSEPVVAWVINSFGDATPIGSRPDMNFASPVQDEDAYVVHPGSSQQKKEEDNDTQATI